MEPNEPARQSGKPKSRLLAMKSRLRQKQKRDALVNAQKTTTTRDMAKCAGKPPLVGRSSALSSEQVDGGKSMTSQRPKPQRSQTMESCLVENKTGNIIAIRRTKRSNTLDVRLGEVSKVGGQKDKAGGGVQVDGNYGPRKLVENRDKENLYRSLPAKYLTSEAYHSGRSSGNESESAYGTTEKQSARERAVGVRPLFQRSSSLDDAERKSSARGNQRNAPLMGSKVMTTRHGSLLQISNSPQRRPGENTLPSQQCRQKSGLDGGYVSRLTSSYGHIPRQVEQNRGQLLRKPNAEIRHPQKQYVLFRSRGLPHTQDDTHSLRDKHLSKSMDDITEVKVAADMSKISAESDPSNNTTLQTNDREVYLREWAVSKPRALLIRREDITKTTSQSKILEPSTQNRASKSVKSHEPTGKERIKDFFTIRRGRLAQPKKYQRSRTLDCRDHLALYGKAARLLGSDPALFRNEAQTLPRCETSVHDPGKNQKGSSVVSDGSKSGIELKPNREESCPDVNNAGRGKGQNVVDRSGATCEPLRKHTTEPRGKWSVCV